MSSSSFQLHLATTPVVSATLEQIAREGARRALQKAIEDEVAAYVDAHCDTLDAAGHRLVVRNGHKPPRTILTGLGPLEVIQPRVDDRRIDENGERFRFTSKILPPYLRKTKTIEELVPLRLKLNLHAVIARVGDLRVRRALSEVDPRDAPQLLLDLVDVGVAVVPRRDLVAAEAKGEKALLVRVETSTDRKSVV